MIATNSLPTLDGRVATPGVLPKPVLALPPLQAVKLLDQVRERIRYLHYSPRTEHVYVYWIRLFIRFHKLRHPRELGAPEVEAFLSWLANARGVAPSTHKQALRPWCSSMARSSKSRSRWMPSGLRSPSDCRWCCRWTKSDGFSVRRGSPDPVETPDRRSPLRQCCVFRSTQSHPDHH